MERTRHCVNTAQKQRKDMVCAFCTGKLLVKHSAKQETHAIDVSQCLPLFAHFPYVLNFNKNVQCIGKCDFHFLLLHAGEKAAAGTNNVVNLAQKLNAMPHFKLNGKVGICT